MTFLIVVFITLIVVFVHMANEKIEYLEIRSKSKKIIATVVEYRKEKSPLRNDYTELNYPYVKIDLDNGEYIIEKLRYANSWSSSLKIGQQVDVFRYGGDLLLWNSFENGIYKFLPKKWTFLD